MRIATWNVNSLRVRLPQLLDPAARLTYDGYVAHGLADLIDRFVVRESGRDETVGGGEVLDVAGSN